MEARDIHWGRVARAALIFGQIPIITCLYVAAHRFRMALLCIACWALMFPILLALRGLKRRGIASGPAVAAIVRFTKVREDPYSFWKRYVLILSYKYYLRDEPYWGSKTVRFLDPCEAEAAGASLLNREVTVHYHPRNPDRSLLA